jgi:hypothetical protein
MRQDPYNFLFRLNGKSALNANRMEKKEGRKEGRKVFFLCRRPWLPRLPFNVPEKEREKKSISGKKLGKFNVFFVFGESSFIISQERKGGGGGVQSS